MTETARQRQWRVAAEEEAQRGNGLSAGLFALLAQPSAQERAEAGQHACLDHAVGFSRDGRRGIRCGICGAVLKWVDE